MVSEALRYSLALRWWWVIIGVVRVAGVVRVVGAAQTVGVAGIIEIIEQMVCQYCVALTRP